MKIRKRYLVFALCCFIQPGCSKKVMRQSPEAVYDDADYGGRSAKKAKSFAFESADVVGYLDSPSPVFLEESAPQSSVSAKDGFEPPAQAPRLPQQAPQTEIKPRRMVTYDGYITTRSINPDSLITVAVALADSMQGYVEVRSNLSVTLRVPVAAFNVVYDSLLKLGEVLNYQKTAEDITDAFRDTDMRIVVLEKTIERYVKLLRLVKEEKEKITLLKEIERLREELEVLRVRKSMLALRAEFAKVVFTVQQLKTGFTYAAAGDLEGFEWIAHCDPLNANSFGKKLVLEVPTGMTALTKRPFWIAQSPAGCKVWTSQVRNMPKGTSTFWINAIACRMKEQYAQVDTSSIGGYRFVRCVPNPGVKYRYYVGVRVVDKDVQVVHCYFPDEVQEKRYLKSIQQVLVAGRTL